MTTLKDTLDKEMEEKKNKDFKQLVDDPQYTNIPKVGDIVKGKVITAGRSLIRLDMDGLAIGVVRGAELYESAAYSDLKAGDEVEATVVDLDNENGELELSFRAAGHRKAWDGVFALLKDGTIVDVKVKDANQGGLLLMYGTLAGFMPVSQLSPEHYPRVPGGDRARILEKLRGFIGQALKVKAIDVDEKSNKLIFSEKSVWEDEKKSMLSAFKIGDLVDGVISALTDFGAFVKFGEVEGLIHISEIAWQRLDHPRDVLKVGDIVKAQIIQIDGSKIFLSRKRLMDDPWKKVAEKYKVGDTVKGKVLKVNPFGFFVELDEDIHGLVHVSSLGAEAPKDLSVFGKEGDEKDFEIITLEPGEHRLGLKFKK